MPAIEASKVKPKHFTVLDNSKSLPNKNKESPCNLARRFLEPKSITLVKKYNCYCLLLRKSFTDFTLNKILNIPLSNQLYALTV